jgi:hypothetical protein
MGYKRNRKLYRLQYEDFPGLEVTARSVSIGKLLDILQLAGDLGAKPDKAKADELFGAFAERIVSWNYEDEDGKPLEPTLETLQGEDSDFVLKLISGWAQAIAGTPDPTAAGNGAMADLEASIPMSPGST